jgi:hypothetical protein
VRAYSCVFERARSVTTCLAVVSTVGSSDSTVFGQCGAVKLACLFGNPYTLYRRLRAAARSRGAGLGVHMRMNA